MFKCRMLFFVTAPRNTSSRVSQVSTDAATEQHVDRRAAKRTAASLVVHFAGTRLIEALMTARVMVLFMSYS